MRLKRESSWRRAALLLMTTALVATGCGSGDAGDDPSATPDGTAGATADAAANPTSSADASEPDTTAAGGKVTYAWSIPLSSLDPHSTPSNFDPIYIGLAYDTLIVREADGSYSPMLAESWTFEGADSLEMKLREGVTFHGGRAFDAEAVRLNHERASATERGAPLASAITSVEVVDDFTVVMTLGDAAGAAFGALSSMSGMMVNPDAFESDLATTADGTGPYRVVEVDPGEGVSYERFDETWAPEDAKADEIEIVANSDSSQRLNQLLTGEADATNIDTFQIPQVEAEGFTTHFRVGSDVFVMQLNWERMSSVEARQAILASVDRELILAGIHDGVGEAGGQLQTLADPGYASELPTGPDVDAAKALAATAGLEGQTLELLTAGVPNLQAYAEAIQPMIEELGASVNVTLVEFGQLTAEWATGNYDLSLIYFTGRPDVALSYQALLAEDSAMNPAGEAPGDLSGLVDSALAETDPDARNGIFQGLAKESQAQGAFMALVHPVQPIVTSPEVSIDEDRLRLFGGFNLRGIGRN